MWNDRAGGTLGRSLLHYYIALKLSAGAIAPLGLPAHFDSPPPIVRRHRRETGGWDPREMIRIGDTVAVLTLPADHDANADGPAFTTLN